MIHLFYEDYVIIFCIVGSLLTAAHLAYSIRAALQRQQLAYAGDTNAAKRIILPCYKPLVRGILLFYLLFAIALILTYVNPSLDSHRLIMYYCFSLMTVYSITPVMLVHTSVSAAAFWRTFYIILPYWAINTIFFGLVDIGGKVAQAFRIIFVWGVTLPPLILSAGILTKRISSRVQLGSNSNRNSAELLLIYSLLFGLLFSISIGCDENHEPKVVYNRHSHNSWATATEATQEQCSPICDIVMVVLTFFINMLFPFALYRTLLADTKFWRGLGTHNQGGILIDDSLRATGVNIHRPTMELAIASTTLQSALAEIHNLTVDFAFLALEQEVGQGATARVFRGRYRDKVVAVKLSTPPEITEEVLETFLKEAKISALFKHRNIVRFLGICVRPPQIGMVFEFCDGGALKSHLQIHAQLWKSPVQRLKGCLDMAKALQALHELGFIHRDIKADNFFVGKKQVVKLGDFGEATRIPHRRLQQIQRQRQQQQSQPPSLPNMRRSSLVRLPFRRQSSVETQQRHSVEPGASSEEIVAPQNSSDGENPDDPDDVETGGGRMTDTATKRMTILGTVAFMAPELVNNARVYSEKIDIYALGIAFWELWTLGSDPYADLSTFQIYAKVTQGERPPLPEDAPVVFNNLLVSCWASEEEDRPSATELVTKLTLLLGQLTRSSSVGSVAESGPSHSTDSSMTDNIITDEDDPDYYLQNFHNINLALLDDENEDSENSNEGTRASLLGSVFRLSQRFRGNSNNTNNSNTNNSISANSSVPIPVPGSVRRSSITTSVQAASRATSNNTFSSNFFSNIMSSNNNNAENGIGDNSRRSSRSTNSSVASKREDMVEMISPVVSLASSVSSVSGMVDNPMHTRQMNQMKVTSTESAVTSSLNSIVVITSNTPFSSTVCVPTNEHSYDDKDNDDSERKSNDEIKHDDSRDNNDKKTNNGIDSLSPNICIAAVDKHHDNYSENDRIQSNNNEPYLNDMGNSNLNNNDLQTVEVI